MSPLISIDLGTGVFDWGDGVNIIYKHRLDFDSLVVEGETVWTYYQVPIDIDSDSPDDPDDERDLQQYTLPGSHGGIYQEYVGEEDIDTMIAPGWKCY